MNSFNIDVPFPVDRVVVRRLKVEDVVLEEAAEGKEPKVEHRETMETLYDGSYDSGVEAGRRQALEQMALVRAEESRQVAGVLRKMNGILDELLKVAEGHFPDLLVQVLERVFREHPFTHAEVANEISAILREVSQAQSIVIEGPAADIAQLESRVEQMGLSIQQGRLQWKPNPTLARGEYILQTDLGMVDGRRHSKLAQVRMALET